MEDEKFLSLKEYFLDFLKSANELNKGPEPIKDRVKRYEKCKEKLNIKIKELK